eukprot:7499117-Pyramimonas_sp.AAC.1
MAISASSFDRLAAASPGVSTFLQKSPAVASAPADWSWNSSQNAQSATICPQRVAGILERAPRPLRTALDREALGRRTEPWQLASDLRGDVAHSACSQGRASIPSG